MQTIDLIGFGRDISKVRSQIEGNLPFLDPSFFLKEILYSAAHSPEWEPFVCYQANEISELLFIVRHGNEGQKWFADWYLDFLLPYFGIVLKELLRGISEETFTVNRFSCYSIELIHFIETNRESVAGKRLHKVFLRRYSAVSLKAWQTLDARGGIAALNVLEELFAEEDQSDPDYDVFFAFTLRQTRLQQLTNFLKEKQQAHQGDFLDFLAIVLIDFADILPEKTRKFAQQWLADVKSLKENTADTALISYRALPDGYQRIEGKLNDVQIRRFFSFLHQETNGSLSEQPFLLKEEVDDLLRYGFSYPLKEPKHKPFSLRLDAQKCLNIVYYAFYQLYTHHRPTLCAKDYKSHFAYFLKHHFDNFDRMSIATLKSSLRGARPKRMRRSFDLVDYFD